MKKTINDYVYSPMPPPERVRTFVADPDPAKRDKLISTLLDSPQYVDFWTYRFADLFRVNHTSLQKLKRTHLHLEWVRLSIAGNKPLYWNFACPDGKSIQASPAPRSTTRWCAASSSSNG